MTRGVTLSLVAVLCLSLAGTATAFDPSTATFQDQGLSGYLTISAPPGTQFIVRGELPGGIYTPIWGGVVDATGVAASTVADLGPEGNGRPQFLINLSGPNGPEQIAIEDPDHKWFWE